MADFRKWVLALSVLALVFTGVAGAQVVGVGTATSCIAGTAVPPQIRSEGYTELVGDVTLVCTGGTAPGLGHVIPQANIVVQLPGTITSRLIGDGSEALLMIDEPGATQLGGFGPAQAQNLCATPLTGCQAWVGVVDGLDEPVNSGGGLAPNVFYGVTNGNQVTFFGVPILAPVTTGDSRVIRITNIRVNANGLTGGGAGFQSVFAYVSVNNVQVSVTNPTVTVGYVQQSFAGTFRDSTNSKPVSLVTEYQCKPVTDAPVAFLRFSELFGTAFKTRVNGSTGGSGFGSYPATVNAATIQNVPGGVYNSESGFISAFSGSDTPGELTNSNGSVAGLADFGTRLKAVFSNLPANVSVYIAAVNETDGTDPIGGAQAGTGVIAADSGSPELAFLVSSEAGVDNADSVPLVTANGFNPPQVLLSPSTTGGATAVWEVVQTLPNTIENYDFGVYVTYANNILPVTGISATLSYAPTPSGPFSAQQAAAPSASLAIPRFAVAAANSGTPFLQVVLCNTALLFPYVTTAGNVAGEAGFETGISIANTTSDPFGTAPQAGLCNLYWYGGVPGATDATATSLTQTVLGAAGLTPPAANVNIISGTTALTEASASVGSGWSGYMIALCNFQFAHGYAAVTDIGVRNIMASYLALVIDDRGGAGIYYSPEALNN